MVTKTRPSKRWWERLEPQVRYADLRWDEENRTLSGVMMVYGETATLSWGDKERFEAGAFGDVSKLDVIINVQHQRPRPLARTGGGGCTLDDTSERLRISARLPDTQEAADTITLIRERVYRGLSIEFLPVKTRVEDGVVVIERAKLINVAVVDRPAYKGATLDWRSQIMDEELRELIESALEKRDVADVSAVTRAVTAVVSSQIGEMRAERDKAVGARDQALAERDQAVEERDEAIGERDEAIAERKKAMGDKKKMEDDMEEMKKKEKKDREQMLGEVQQRADLLVRVAPLLNSDVETREMSNHAILVAAVGDEVADASERSADYLEAKVEGILERRQMAGGLPKVGGPAPTGVGSNKPGDPVQHYGRSTMLSMIEERVSEGGKY